jgi:DNA repair protein RadC
VAVRAVPVHVPLHPAVPNADPAEAEARLLGLLAGGGPAHARELLARAGGLAALADHSPEELTRHGGLSPRRARAVAAAFELGRMVAASRAAPGWTIRSPADVGERLSVAMAGLPREELRVLLLNTKNVVTAGLTVYAGNLAGSSVRVGEVFRDAVRRQAAAIVVVHNHPSGDPAPSADDLRITAELAEAGRLLDIELLDHVIVGGSRWVSLRALGPPPRTAAANRAPRPRGDDQSATTTRWIDPPMSAR